MMKGLNLPDHGVEIRQRAEGDLVFDPVRRRWVVLTPEEWVRQHVLNHLIRDLCCPLSLIAVEHSLVLNRMARRADILVHGPGAKPLLLVECKAPGVKLDTTVFEQAARYNTVFKVPFLLVTNGLAHSCCQIGPDGTFEFLPAVPDWETMSKALSA
jgi:virulence-associated protein VagC